MLLFIVVVADDNGCIGSNMGINNAHNSVGIGAGECEILVVRGLVDHNLHGVNIGRKTDNQKRQP